MRTRGGLRGALSDFTAARLPALLPYAKLLTGDGDGDEAEDLVREVLTKALLRWRRMGAMDEPYAYVRTMLTNQFLSASRRRKFRLVRPAAAVLVLRYYEVLGDDQIAEVLRCRPGKVRGYAQPRARHSPGAYRNDHGGAGFPGVVRSSDVHTRPRSADPRRCPHQRPFRREDRLDLIWSTDHLIASAPVLDGAIVLAAAAGATERIKLASE